MNTEEQNIIEEQSSCSEGLRYSGHIKVSTMVKDKVISTKTFHNNGTKNLFTFFANCLWGTQGSATEYKPCKIVLFTANEAENKSGSTTQSNKTYDCNYWTETYAASLPMFYDKTPTGVGSSGPTDVIAEVGPIGKKKKVVVGKEVTLHFRVPFLYLTDGAVIKKMGLFPSSVTFPNPYGIVDTGSEFGSMVAYYFLTDENDNWDGIEVPTSGGNFTIVVDWTLRISNV